MSDQTIQLIIPQKKPFYLSDEIRTEIIRKTIHMCIALVPLLAQLFGRVTIVGMLIAGILVYTLAESLRCRGKNVFVISRLTQLSSRRRDQGHFVLAPVTLGIGTVLALTLYSEPAASIAIYALAFGDGLSSLFGKVFASTTLPFSKNKSLAGSITCFAAVLISSFLILQDMTLALFIATVATVLEMVPIKDFDNILLPVGTGFLTLLLLT